MGLAADHINYFLEQAGKLEQLFSKRIFVILRKNLFMYSYIFSFVPCYKKKIISFLLNTKEVTKYTFQESSNYCIVESEKPLSERIMNFMSTTYGCRFVTKEAIYPNSKSKFKMEVGKREEVSQDVADESSLKQNAFVLYEDDICLVLAISDCGKVLKLQKCSDNTIMETDSDNVKVI